MNTEKINKEGYNDPTAYGALMSIQRKEKALKAYKPIVYICSPFAGDKENNIINARKYSRFAVERGYLPLTPHLLFPQFLDDNNKTERQLGLNFGLQLLSLCREVWVFGQNISEGMKNEIKRARWKNTKVRFFNDMLIEQKEGKK